MKKIIVHSDGGARGNPGPAAIGVVVTNEANESLLELSEAIGDATNNIAEYTAVLRGLQEIKLMFAAKTRELEVDWRLDSELVKKQLSGEYKIKNPGLRTIFLDIQDLRAHFPRLTFTHVRREYNQEADRLVNEALDQS